MRWFSVEFIVEHCQIALETELILLIDVNLGCIDSHARGFTLPDGTARRERTSPPLLHFYPRDLHGAARSCIELSRSRNRSRCLFHVCILGIDFHERLPQITDAGVSFDRAVTWIYAWQIVFDRLYSSVRDNRRFCRHANAVTQIITVTVKCMQSIVRALLTIRTWTPLARNNLKL